MNLRDARQLFHEDRRATQILDDVRASQLIPEFVAAAGYGSIDEPEVLFLTDGGVLRLKLEAGAGETPTRTMIAELIRIDKCSCEVRVTQSWAGDQRFPVRKREWSIRLSAEVPILSFATEQALVGFDDEKQPSADECFARELARRLGYAIPQEPEPRV